MDIQQLKLLAGRVRGLLEQSRHSIGHNQSLDLIAALPGLRNWPEVQAFPDRVAACELDQVSTGRLVFRLKRKFDLDFSPQSMLAALHPPGTMKEPPTPQIWPTGSSPGVYITDSQDAINALLESYEEATDGALVYAERAGNHWESSIDLGEGGLWSSGLQRVPSGTLIVVGPLMLDQQSWTDSSEHLHMACLIAQGAQHRVAVLIETPAPATMFEDIQLMVASAHAEDDDCETALLGLVDADGQLQLRQPFGGQRPIPKRVRSVATPDAIPASVRNQMERVITGQTAGLLLLGSSEVRDHAAIELVAAALSMTEHAGPAARIMPRHRSTPAKDWQVPQSIQELPFLPSLESAYDQGDRRMIFAPSYTPSELLMRFSDDCLLISGTYGSGVDEVFMSALRFGSLRNEGDLLSRIIAILGVKSIPGVDGTATVSDLYVRQQKPMVVPTKFEDLIELLQAHRAVRWQDEMGQLLSAGTITSAATKLALQRNRGVAEFLSEWSERPQARGEQATPR